MYKFVSSNLFLKIPFDSIVVEQLGSMRYQCPHMCSNSGWKLLQFRTTVLNGNVTEGSIAYNIGTTVWFSVATWVLQLLPAVPKWTNPYFFSHMLVAADIVHIYFPLGFSVSKRIYLVSYPFAVFRLNWFIALKYFNLTKKQMFVNFKIFNSIDCWQGLNKWIVIYRGVTKWWITKQHPLLVQWLMFVGLRRGDSRLLIT